MLDIPAVIACGGGGGGMRGLSRIQWDSKILVRRKKYRIANTIYFTPLQKTETKAKGMLS